MKLFTLTILLSVSALLLMCGMKMNESWIVGVAGFGLSSAMMGAWFK